MTENKQEQTAYEEARLQQTIAIAKEQLDKARKSAQEKPKKKYVKIRYMA